jgi:hypothetical protein
MAVQGCCALPLWGEVSGSKLSQDPADITDGCIQSLQLCQVSAVSIATRYGLDGPGSNSGEKARFSALVQAGPGAHPASYTMGTGSFPGVKWPRRSVDHPPSSSTEVQERVKLYFFFPSWPVLRWNRSILLVTPQTAGNFFLPIARLPSTAISQYLSHVH